MLSSILVGKLRVNVGAFFPKIVRPIVLYGVVVWWTATKRQFIKNIMTKVQRRVCITISELLKTTTTDALQTLLHITRMPEKWLKLWKYKNYGHTEIWCCSQLYYKDLDLNVAHILLDTCCVNQSEIMWITEVSKWLTLASTFTQKVRLSLVSRSHIANSQTALDCQISQRDDRTAKSTTLQMLVQGSIKLSTDKGTKLDTCRFPVHIWPQYGVRRSTYLLPLDRRRISTLLLAITVYWF